MIDRTEIYDPNSNPNTVLQPSLHTLEEFTGMVLSECEVRGIEVSDLREEFTNADPNGESFHEIRGDIERDAIERLTSVGYEVYDDNDTFLIMPK